LRRRDHVLSFKLQSREADNCFATAPLRALIASRGAGNSVGYVPMFRGSPLYESLFRAMLAVVGLLAVSGCSMIVPDVSHQPVIHNPFPQLSRVAVAPFFNQSDESTVDGREFALAYFAELQAVPGFEVVPLGVVEEAIIANEIDLSSAGAARQLAQVLGVDAVVIGAVTDYQPYYPPRCGLRVEWYSANPGFHEIPPGYGLPWGTPQEEFIPAPLVFESEMALARAQLATQTPVCLPANGASAQPVSKEPTMTSPPTPDGSLPPDLEEAEADGNAGAPDGEIAVAYQEEELPASDSVESPATAPAQSDSADAVATTGVIGAYGAPGALPPDWPDERGFIPPPPGPVRPPCVPNDGPVMTHTRIYHGSDSEFTAALASYYYFRDDARFGGWQNYLQRSDDFIRFCCHMHISEMLSARGGAGETRVVWRWPDSR